MKKKIIFCILIFIIFFITIFIIFEYKKNNLGNNISVSDNVDILNISSYEAIVEIEVHSNKNTNKYIMRQKYLAPNMFEQEVLEPNNIKGLKIATNENEITVQNGLLDLKTIYSDFDGNVSNLCLISFVNNFKKGIESYTEENNTEIIMSTKINESLNKYQMYQNLYISKDSKLPIKMEILDVNKNITVYILYKEITINKLRKNEIL